MSTLVASKTALRRKLPHSPLPPRPNKERKEKPETTKKRKQRPATRLLEAVVAANTTLYSDQRSKSTAKASPTG
jgi:hypothetical protein